MSLFGEITKKIKWSKVWEILRLVSSFGLAVLMENNPAGLMIGGVLIAWPYILSLLALLGIGHVARDVVPDKYIPLQSLRTGDGTASVSATLAKKLEVQQVAQDAVSAQGEQSVAVDVTVKEAEVTPPKIEP